MTGRLQIKNNRYYMILNCKTTDGRYIQKWFKTGLLVQNNRRKAEQMLREKLQELDNNTNEPVSNIVFADFVNKWLEIKRFNIQTSTYENYKIVARHHIIPFFEKTRKTLSEITAYDIQTYFTMKLNSGLNPNTVWKHKILLNGVFSYALMQDLIPKNPLNRVISPQKKESL